MNIIWTRSLVSLALLAVLSGIVGVLFGVRAALCFALFMLVLQTLFTTFHTQRLWRLLDAPVYGEVPSAPGVWGERYYRLHKLAKRWHGQVRRVGQRDFGFITAYHA